MNKFEYKVQGVNYEVEIEDVEGNVAKVKVNDIPFDVELNQPIKAAPKVKKVEPAPAVPHKSVTKPTPVPASTTPGEGIQVTAPLPGTIVDIKVSVGQKVHEGDTVVVLEAMKMQNNIEAENDGTITSVMVNSGDTVMEGTVLVTIG